MGEAALKIDPHAPLQGATLGQRIRCAYLRAGMNRTKFMKQVDVAYTTVLNWEKDIGEIRNSNLERIAEVTGFSVEELRGRDARIVREPEIVYPALEEYREQKKAQGKPLTESRFRELATFRWKHGKPTVQSYAFLDAAWDSTLPADVAEAQATVTAAATARALARGGKPLVRR